MISDERNILKAIFEIFTPTNEGLIKGLSTNYAIYSTISIEMYRYIVCDISTVFEKH